MLHVKIKIPKKKMILKKPLVKRWISSFFNYCKNKKLLKKIIKLVFPDPQKVFPGSGHLNFLRNTIYFLQEIKLQTLKK